MTATSVATASLAIALIAGLPAYAQKPPKVTQGGPGSTMEIAKAEGKFEAQQQQTIKISTAEKKDVFLVINQDTVVRYSGEAEPTWLTPGLMVRFSANFENGRPVGSLKNLEVFMPLMTRRMTAEQMREQSLGVHQEGKPSPPGAKDLFKDNATKPGNQKSPPAAAAPAASGGQSYRVVGRIVGLQKNTLILQVGQPLQVELDPNAAISVTASDTSFVTQGDAVSVKGLRNPTVPDWIQAEEIEIKSSKKLSQAQPTSRGRQRGARGKDAVDPKDPKNVKDVDNKPGDGKKPNPNDKKAGAAKPTSKASDRP